MRRHYLTYLKALPGIKEFRNRLVTLADPDEINAVLDEILVKYEGFEMEKAPIQLVNYHENCPV